MCAGVWSVVCVCWCVECSVCVCAVLSRDRDITVC